MTGNEWMELVRMVCFTVFFTSTVWAVAWVIRG